MAVGSFCVSGVPEGLLSPKTHQRLLEREYGLADGAGGALPLAPTSAQFAARRTAHERRSRQASATDGLALPYAS